ncbi:iron uptake transporter deferrochelatase/peroxidase subunit [Faucicola atlantae]|uniref:iron uptake transporter deferrochelatase/peroxidase subunit n=1 Tax=Faucicola atlantae TaxID=34059 RepID=UPI0009F3F248|nr:iron uptake transporter deferrochelatase/peroxidase subunit [Moraxella atlantae]
MATRQNQQANSEGIPTDLRQYTNQTFNADTPRLDRRRFLTSLGVIGATGAAGALGLSACQPTSQSGGTAAVNTASSASNDNPTNTSQVADKNENPKHAGSDANSTKNCFADSQYDFYGQHQAGITTPTQRQNYFLVLDLHTTDRAAIVQMFKDWTEYAARLTQGDNIKPYGDSPFVPPVDTGEADSLGAYGLTITFGISPSFLKKLGMEKLAPPEFASLPAFPRDQIRPELAGGDICIQACAEDSQVAFHAVRQLVRQARSNITMRWSQMGFVSFDSGNETPRNLFAFKDGTANQNTIKAPNDNIWIDRGWLKDGTYLVVRLIQMHLETWDRTSLKGQEETFGRHRDSGAAIGKTGEFDDFDVNASALNGKPLIPEISHMSLAKRTGLHILRRSYSYASGIDPKTGQFNAGLLFISFQKSPAQFIGIQNALGRLDKMNEYTTHIGSGLFACFGGVQSGQYIGQALFEQAEKMA